MVILFPACYFFPFHCHSHSNLDSLVSQKKTKSHQITWTTRAEKHCAFPLRGWPPFPANSNKKPVSDEFLANKSVTVTAQLRRKDSNGQATFTRSTDVGCEYVLTGKKRINGFFAMPWGRATLLSFVLWQRNRATASEGNKHCSTESKTHKHHTSDVCQGYPFAWQETKIPNKNDQSNGTRIQWRVLVHGSTKWFAEQDTKNDRLHVWSLLKAEHNRICSVPNYRCEGGFSHGWWDWWNMARNHERRYNCKQNKCISFYYIHQKRGEQSNIDCHLMSMLKIINSLIN